MSFNPKQKYQVKPDTIAIKDFHDYSEDYVTRPPYQRKNVWSTKKKQDILDSLFRRYYIPKIIIREVRLNDETTVKEMIDGQQRITAVQEFFEGKLKIPKSLKDLVPGAIGKAYTALDSDIRKFIDKELKFTADVVTGIEDPKNHEHQKVATEIFWRLQQGESLNYMEIAHARLASIARNFIVKYSDDISFDFVSYKPIDKNKFKHKFFTIISRKNERMQHLMLMARFLLIEHASDGIPELKDSAVADFIDKYMQEDGVGNDSYEQEHQAKAVIANLNAFCLLFQDDILLKGGAKVKELSAEYIILSFYLLLRHLRQYYVMQEAESKTLHDFILEVHQRLKNPDDEDRDVLSFQAHRQQSKDNLEARHIILRQLFFDYLKSKKTQFKTKDAKRSFNEAARIRIYRRDKGLCQKCLAVGKPESESFVPWLDYEADHIVAHIRGGETVVANAQVLCKHHNRSKGARE